MFTARRARHAPAIAIALLLLLAATLLCAHPASASEPVNEIRDVDGNVLADGSEIDVETFSKGLVFYFELTPVAGKGNFLQFFVNGKRIIGVIEAQVLKVDGKDISVWHKAMPSLLPGDTVTIRFEQYAGETLLRVKTLTLTIGGGSGDDAGSGDDPGGGSGGDEPADEPGRGDGGEDDGPGDDEPASPDEGEPAGEPADEPGNGGKPADEPAGGSTGSGGSDKSGERTGTDDGSDKPGKSGSGSDASPKGDGSEGGGSPSQTSPSSTDDDAGETAPTAAADDGAEQASGPEDPDELQVYRIGGSIGGSGGGSGSDPAASASQLTVTGVPWMWALLWAVLALAAPLSAAGRLAAPRLGRSRLEE